MFIQFFQLLFLCFDFILLYVSPVRKKSIEFVYFDRIITMTSLIDEINHDKNERNKDYYDKRNEPLRASYDRRQSFCSGFKLAILSRRILYVKILVSVEITCRLVIKSRVSYRHLFADRSHKVRRLIDKRIVHSI